MNSQEEWWTDAIRFDAANLGYVMLQLPQLKLPTLQYAGVEFEVKQELHCSLLSIPSLASYSNEPVDALALQRFAKAFIQSSGIRFKGFGAALYLCKENDARSIIVDAQVQGAYELFAALRENFSYLAKLPDPLLHVTLYKYKHRFGIGIHDEAELKQLCQLIPEAEMRTVRELLLKTPQ